MLSKNNNHTDPAKDLDEPCQFQFECDDTLAEPFFTLLLSTRRLLDSTDRTKPLEIDETFKLIYENYPVTLIGQSDADRKFHLIAVGISTNSTQEVGEFFLRALLREIPDLMPRAYLGDAAEAFANAFRAIWPFALRLMCYAHVYKVKNDSCMNNRMTCYTCRPQL